MENSAKVNDSFNKLMDSIEDVKKSTDKIRNLLFDLVKSLDDMVDKYHNMNLIEKLRFNILYDLPTTTTKLDEPVSSENGMWWLNLSFHDNKVVVQWSEKMGFGISASDEPGYNCGPDEIFKDYNEAADRVVHLLKSGDRTNG